MIGERRARYAGYGTRELFVDGREPKLVLVHGFGHPADCWRPVLQRCERTGQAAVAPDLPGFGAADALAPGPLIPQLVRFLDAAVRHHAGNESVVLAGNSLGAVTAVQLLDSVPGVPVSGLVALDMAGAHWAPLVRAVGRGNWTLLRLLAALPAPTRLRVRVADVCAGVLLYGDRRAVDPELVRHLSSQIGNAVSANGLIEVGIRFKREAESLSPPTRIDCPTVIIHGRRDRLVAPATSRALHAAIPGSRLLTLAGIGHCPHLDAPDTVTALALDLATAAGRSETA
ncbi:alpha/beta fold hydrolase [Nocardia thailandica]|uniref:alpha/beta fold hydrolase n=1 Tax=Nocardia thailandica TaxID=257275 RepID=UPI0002E1B2C1|nr:alpha/beta hydrolase [Nocardia thailandica]